MTKYTRPKRRISTSVSGPKSMHGVQMGNVVKNMRETESTEQA